MLPEGRLLAISLGKNGATFLVQDGQAKAGRIVVVSVYQVFEPGLRVGQATVAQAMARWRIDCGARTVESESSSGFDAHDRFIIAAPPEAAKPMTPETSQDVVGKVVCDGVELPPENIITGYKAAAQVARGMIQSVPPP